MLQKGFRALLVLLVACGSAYAQDAIDLSQVTVYNSPGDVADWPITTRIRQLHMRPLYDPIEGVSLSFSAQSTWPDYTPPGWGGPIVYTVWAVVKVNGQWYTSGFIQMWRDRASTGAPILTDFAINWAYDSRWGPMQGHQPQVGEQMGFFVTAGNARGVTTVTSVRERSNVVMVSLPANDTGDFGYRSSMKNVFAGGNQADLAVYRQSSHKWYVLQSTQYNTSTSYQWGTSGDVPVPADYDGDSQTDVATWVPSTGAWYILTSRSNYTQSLTATWGSSASNDVPVVADYDGDWKADIAVWRPSTGMWHILLSSTGYAVSVAIPWGTGSMNDIPVPEDYDGDGRADLAVWRPSTGTWYVLTSGSSYTQVLAVTWGSNALGDKLLVDDYDGDGKADPAVWRPSTGMWFILKSSSNYSQYIAVAWGSGASNDIPVPADYDGDGKADLAVWRPGTGVWYALLSGSTYSSYLSIPWGSGSATDIPVGTPHFPSY